jgi:hypothetical protein
MAAELFACDFRLSQEKKRLNEIWIGILIFEPFYLRKKSFENRRSAERFDLLIDWIQVQVVSNLLLGKCKIIFALLSL